MDAIIFRAFLFRPFPKKKHRERTGFTGGKGYE